MSDAGRPFDHDGATSVFFNIADQPWSNAVGGQVIYSNHPLNSLVGQVVWRSGGQSEVWLRMAPALAAAALIGLVFREGQRRWGAPVGTSAALILGLNPLFLSIARSVRGYSMMMLGLAVGSLLVIKIADRERRGLEPDPWQPVVYSIAMGLGIGAHAYGGMVLLAHVGFLASSSIPLRPWLARIGGALLVGGALYAALLRAMLAGRGRRFNPGFPAELALTFGGGLIVVAALLWFGFAYWLYSNRSDRRFLAVAAVLLSIFAILWLVMASVDLFPRFFLAVLPIFALGAAASLGRGGWIATSAVAVAMALSFVSAYPELSSRNDSREAAELVDRVAAADGTACALGWTGFNVAPYTENLQFVITDEEIRVCDLLLSYQGAFERERSNAATRLPSTNLLIEDSRYVAAWSEEIDETVRRYLADLSLSVDS